MRRGQTVRAGQVLFELDPWPDAGKVAEAEAVLAAAQADHAAARLGWGPARIAALGHVKSAILAAES